MKNIKDHFTKFITKKELKQLEASLERAEAEFSELVVLFDLKQKENEICFVPYRVIQGYYSELAGMFLDIDREIHVHMSDYLLFEDWKLSCGSFFGCRVSIQEMREKYPECTILELQEKLLLEALRYSYMLGYDMKDGHPIIEMMNNKTFQVEKFSDCDYLDRGEFLSSCKGFLSNFDEQMEDELPVEKEEAKPLMIDPHSLAEKIKQDVFGQDEAVNRVVQTIWKHYYQDSADQMKYPKGNMLIVGPTGSGKTEIFRCLNKALPDIDVYIADMTSITSSGFVGDSLVDIFKSMLLRGSKVVDGVLMIDVERLEHSVIVLDEIDKIAFSNSGDHNNDIGTKDVQQELLKIIEGKEMTIPLQLGNSTQLITFKTDQILFVGCGAFDGITKNVSKALGFNQDISLYNKQKSYQMITDQDFIQYGYLPELIGRMPVVIQLDELTLETLVAIVKKKSLFIKNLRILKSLVQEVQIDNGVYEEIGREALAKKRGARGLDQVSEELFYPILFEASDSRETYEMAIMNEETVKNPKHYTLVRKKEN